MTYRWLSDLDQCFTAAGVPFTPVGYSSADPTGAADWRTRGRPASTGQFNPQGVLCHHTASPAGTSAQADLNVILRGNGEAPGPISQLYVSRDARLFIVAAGRANHGGSGRRPGIDSSCADMNAALIGIEAGNNGTGEYWPDAMTNLYGATVAALCAWYGWRADQIYLHATTGPPGGGCNSKIDPAGPWQYEPQLVGSQTWNLDRWRDFVSDIYAGGEQEDDVLDDTDKAWLQEMVTNTVLGIVRSEEFSLIVREYARGPSGQDRATLSDAQGDGNLIETRASAAVLGVVRSQEFAEIIANNTA